MPSGQPCIGEQWQDTMPGQPICIVERIVPSNTYQALVQYAQGTKHVVQPKNTFLQQHIYAEPEPKSIWERLLEENT